MKRNFPYKHIKTFADIPKLVIYDNSGFHTECVSFSSIDAWVDGDEFHTIILDPEYQRGHVWSMRQRIAYVEYLLRGGRSSIDIIFNQRPGDGWNPFECIDGLQRITSVHMFMHDKLKVFDGLTCSEMVRKSKYKKFPWNDYHLNIKTTHIATDAEIMRFYLELNDGGTPHSASEIERVRKLYVKARRAEATKPKQKPLQKQQPSRVKKDGPMTMERKARALKLKRMSKPALKRARK